MADIEWLLNKKGQYIIKAMTPAARDAMGKDMGGPWVMAAEVFWHVDSDKFPGTLQRLKAMGLDIGDDSEPWTF